MRPGNIIDIIPNEAATMSLKLRYQSMDPLQANWWPSPRMAHHNIPLCGLLSVLLSQYRRTTEKNHCCRLSWMPTIIATRLAKMGAEILISDIWMFTILFLILKPKILEISESWDPAIFPWLSASVISNTTYLLVCHRPLSRNRNHLFCSRYSW